MFQKEREIGNIFIRKAFWVIHFDSDFILQIIEVSFNIHKLLLLVLTHSTETEFIDMITEN